MAEEIGADMTGWRRPPPPGPASMMGRHVRLAPLTRGHAAALHAATRGHDGLWTYMGYGPFADEDACAEWVASVAGRADPRFYAIFPGRAAPPAGVASLMRAEVAHGVVEIGHICLAPALQRTPAASEAIFLLADWAFAAGYRRLEWKCDARNAASRRAAERFGFAFEGVFRQHMIVKGRSRDTAWFAILDRDWPNLRAAHRRWLDPANFDAEGRQILRLSDLTAPLGAAAAARAHSGA